jgi:ankyrin repeat protein
MTVLKGGSTALMWAAAAGHTAIVQSLLHAGADPNLKTHRGLKAVHYAKDGKHDETVRLLRTAAKTAKRRKNPSWKPFGLCTRFRCRLRIHRANGVTYDFEKD